MSIDPLQDPCNGICKLEKDLKGFKWNACSSCHTHKQYVCSWLVGETRILFSFFPETWRNSNNMSIVSLIFLYWGNKDLISLLSFSEASSSSNHM